MIHIGQDMLCLQYAFFVIKGEAKVPHTSRLNSADAVMVI